MDPADGRASLESRACLAKPCIDTANGPGWMYGAVVLLDVMVAEEGIEV